MTITATLVGGVNHPTPLAALGLDDVNVALPDVLYSFPSVLPEVQGTSEPNTIVVSGLAPTILFADFPAPITAAQFVQPGAPAAWVQASGNATLTRAMIDTGTYIFDIHFNGDGPTAREFVVDWSLADLMRLGPTINGIAFDPIDDPETPDEPLGPLIGTSANDSLEGSSKGDEMSGRGGNDRLDGFDGRDSMKGGNGEDNLYGGRGKDRLEGGKHDDSLSGGDARDVLLGGAGDDTLVGGVGNDVQKGGAGDDKFYDGPGNDKMFGQAGADQFYFYDSYSTGGKNKIIGYNPEEDRIFGNTAFDPDVVSGFKYFGDVADAFEALDYDVTFSKRKVVIDQGDYGKLVVKLSAPLEEPDDFWNKVLWDFG